MKFSVKHRMSGHLTSDLDYEVRRSGDEITVIVDGRSLTAEIVATDHDQQDIVLQVNGRHIHIKRHRDDRLQQLWVNGQTVTYERIQPHQDSIATGGGRLTTDIPAVVSQLLVEVGQHVPAGEKLILLESMKMVIPLVAPSAGEITAIHCQVGEAVQPGVTLIEMGEG
jgi:biotin carboxyl carrier protein